MSTKARVYILGLGAAALVTAGVVVLVIQLAGGDGEGDTTRAALATEAPRAQEAPPATELTGLLGSTDLSVGANRVSFLLTSPTALITAPDATVSSVYLPKDGSPEVIKETATAPFYLWPFGVRGNYATQLFFDKPGKWRLDVHVQDTDGFAGTARIPLEVKEASLTPAVGSRPPLAVNKTLSDVTSLGELTSWSTPDPELYQLTIPEALASRQPLLLVFASPAFCTSPTCGPQVDTVQQLKERFKGQAAFIHVEVYDNPEEIQGDLDQARYSPVVEAWNLTSIPGYLNESWVFIMDREGRITGKYEGFASEEELEAGLSAVLR